MPLLTLKAQIHAAPEVEALLKEAMRSATKVYNGLLWHLREAYQKTGRVDLSRKGLNRILKGLPRAKDYYSMSVQLTREEVREAYKAFFALKRQGKTRHQAPGFRRKGYLSPLRYVQSGFKVEGDRVTVSLGTGRKDGVRQVSFRVAHRPGVRYERVRQLSIVYDKLSGRLEARLTVEVEAAPKPGKGRAALDLGETVLMAAAFDDGSAYLYSGRGLKAVRRYWQKVRANLKRGSRRWREVAHRERLQVDHLLRQAALHFLRECARRGVGEVVVGDLSGLREGLDYGEVLNQRLHAWPYRKLVEILRYKGALMGIAVREVEERKTSITCHACGKASPSNRKHRGFYACSCGWRAQADVNGALNIYERAFQVSPVKGSSGRVARPVVRSFRLGWHGVHEPKREENPSRAS
ncbi:RNA-guided endonuclease InsQ/TnpB family protein [Thermus sp.]|uniref:RNA-guided endonuclease InsQ/TnpB family protein n=1 Tax=Thermus sp. TaxID=275 RepID=UPI003D10D47C